MQRKSTLRESINFVKKKKSHKQTGRLQGRILFRSVVRRILENIDWIKEWSDFTEESKKSTTSVIFQPRKSINVKALTNEDRSFLLIQPHLRTKEDKLYLVNLIKTLTAFKKYPENVRESIAAACWYQYLGPGRIIVRQGDPASNLYYIINGQVSLTKVEMDTTTGKETEISVGTMGPRDIFGEVALLHSLPRLMTVTTKTSVELLFITKQDFNRLLKARLLRSWNQLQGALESFKYFQTWDEATVRECCIFCKIKDYGSNEVLLGDGKGMVNYVYFLMSGRCRLIEHMLILHEGRGKNIKYKLYKPESSATPSQSSNNINYEVEGNHIPEKTIEAEGENEDELSDQESEKENSEDFDIHNSQGEITDEQAKAVTVMLQDIINQWHKLTGIAEAMMQQHSAPTQHNFPEKIKPYFMQVCEFTKGACFGLDEEMENRRIVSITPVRCLLIPRHWLFKHNRGNIWKRVSLFLNSKYPTHEELFKKFVVNRRWIKYKKELIDDIIKRKGRNIYNNTTINDVPYSIRIKDSTNFT